MLMDNADCVDTNSGSVEQDNVPENEGSDPKPAITQTGF